MNKLATSVIAGALLLSFGAATSFAGDRVLKSQGRSGYVYAAERQETTVAVYTGNRRSEASVRDREDTRSNLQINGRAGVTYRND